MKKNTTTLAILVFFIYSFCNAQHPYTYKQPKTLNDGWKTENLKFTHIDTSLIFKALNQIKNRENKIHSVLLIKNNKLIIEEYFKKHNAKTPHDIRSVTKSIRSILLGIAIDKGFIENINDPILKYLKTHVPKKHLDNRKKNITIKNLLTMSSGLDCNDWDSKSKGQEDKVSRKKDWIQYTLDLPLINKPGTVSNYCSMGTVLIAEIISQSSGMTINEFAEKYLFNPLQITQANWGHTSKEAVIPSAKRLYLTSRDLAKIGQLILNNGTWKGKQIVSKNWVEASTTTNTKIANVEYGYLWWNIPFNVNQKVFISKTATGNGGQYIMIIPELEIVAVFTGGAYNSPDDKLPFALLGDIIIPAFSMPY
ncbi:serine hydrolase [Postechiella marina]|uniref:Serine hydrolase n=1 Tax=Postechiella marina TaxID=943941 RepID=A0ABP8CDD9_9FLAO